MHSASLRKRFVATALLCSSLLAGGFAQAQTPFSATYTGAGTAGGSCAMSYPITAVEPSAPGRYPLFIYMVGTTEPHNAPHAMAAINAMVAKGYVAATVDYASSAFGACPELTAKAKCVFDPGSSTSAVAQLCSRGKTDCSKGIVVGGFSQGSILATVAKNYDSRVQAAYGMGTANQYFFYNLDACVKPANRVLPSDRLRLVNGESDVFTGGNAYNVKNSLQQVTGYVCPTGAYSCLATNQSGWLIVKNAQVLDGQADHCYMDMNGTCGGSVETNWRDGPAAWSLNANLEWLTKYTAR